MQFLSLIRPYSKKMSLKACTFAAISLKMTILRLKTCISAVLNTMIGLYSHLPR